MFCWLFLNFFFFFCSNHFSFSVIDSFFFSSTFSSSVLHQHLLALLLLYQQSFYSTSIQLLLSTIWPIFNTSSGLAILFFCNLIYKSTINTITKSAKSTKASFLQFRFCYSSFWVFSIILFHGLSLSFLYPKIFAFLHQNLYKYCNSLLHYNL